MNPYFLSKSDVSILMNFIGELKRGNVNNFAKGGQARTWDSGDDQVATGDLIAIPVTHDGIDGLTIKGPLNPDGKFGGALQIQSGGDVPGVGLCDIYKLRTSGPAEHSELVPIEKQVKVYNLSQERLGRDWLTVTKNRQGDWIATPKEVFLEGILLSPLERADGPLTGAKAALMLVIEHGTYTMNLFTDSGSRVNRPIEEVVPSTWKTTNRILSCINRSISMRGAPGTYGKFRKCGGELRPVDLDCAPSEEGVQVVILYEETIISGGFGSGGYGDGTYGG